jgi:hypothetical protein
MLTQFPSHAERARGRRADGRVGEGCAMSFGFEAPLLLMKERSFGGYVKKLLLTLVVLGALVAIGIKTGVIRLDHPIDA